MKKQVEKYINPALTAARKIAESETGDATTVYEEYDGYAASFGASMLTAGLLPTISFYTNVHKKDKDNAKELKKPRRYKMVKALAEILKTNELYNKISTDDIGLLEYVRNDYRYKDSTFKKEILAASIALKLALRNFKHIKSGEKS